MYELTQNFHGIIRNLAHVFICISVHTSVSKKIEEYLAFAEANENVESELEIGRGRPRPRRRRRRRLLDPLTLRTKVTRELLYESPEGNVWQLVCASFFHGNGGERREEREGRKEEGAY